MPEICTIGHSNRSADALLATLRAHGVVLLVDIRAFPRSRRHPHFDRAALQATLASNTIAYQWRGDVLGGFRKPRAGSPHTALTDAAFRGFADYMDSADFAAAVEQLLALTAKQRTAIMCAEADYQHCHRQFIADYLNRRGITVTHLISPAEVTPHRPNPCLDTASEPAVYNKHEQGDLFASH